MNKTTLRLLSSLLKWRNNSHLIILRERNCVLRDIITTLLEMFVTGSGKKQSKGLSVTLEHQYYFSFVFLISNRSIKKVAD